MRAAPNGEHLRDKQFNLRLVEGKNDLKLVHLRWSGITWAFLVLLLLVLFFIYKSTMVDVLWMKLTVMTVCLGLAAAFLFGLLTQAYDGIVVTANALTYRYGLGRRSFTKDQIKDIEARTKIHHWTDEGEPRVDVRVEIWLAIPGREFQIFDLHGKEADTARMEQLGHQIRTAILRRIR